MHFGSNFLAFTPSREVVYLIGNFLPDTMILVSSKNEAKKSVKNRNSRKETLIFHSNSRVKGLADKKFPAGHGFSSQNESSKQ